MALEPLPIDEHLPHIAEEVSHARAAVVVAAPGAGKTTRVPAALLPAGDVMVLQPRRVAARAVARRIAEERGWRVGGEVGWHVRFDRRFCEDTRLLIVTEGMLTARLQSDPLLSGFSTIVIDEFHERSIHADVALALARQAWLARDDLRIVIMSATIDPAPISRFLNGCPVINIPGRLFPVAIDYLPETSLGDAVAATAKRTAGDVLCFLPGAGEIARAAGQLSVLTGDAIELIPLHGSLDAQEQDRVFRPSNRRRVVLATNIAETSLTVPRVTAVVDTGLHKVARYDAARAIDSLEIERITRDSAEQRAGRAGRLSAGLAVRLWNSRDRLRPQREPEIARVDLSAAILDVVAWGGDPKALDWFERPSEAAMDAAIRLLRRLEALDGSHLSDIGRQLQRLPLHPRLGRVLVAAGGAWEAAVACAVMSERSFIPERSAATSCDLLGAIDRFDALPTHVQHVARQIVATAQRACGAGAREHIGEADLRRAILTGFPDRVARRRAQGAPRLLLSSGTGARLTAESGVTSGEFLVSLDVLASSDHGNTSEARVRIASRVEREWLEPTEVVFEHRLDPDAGVVRATESAMYDALELQQRPAPVDPDRAATLLADAYIARGPSVADVQLLRRLEFAGHPVVVDALAYEAARRARRLADMSLHDALPRDEHQRLNALAPERLAIPSGRTVALEYRPEGTVSAAVKLQELFGLAETPRVGVNRQPVIFLLLAPNGRPVQTTSDLRSFWERTYPEVRKELRGRYPKHPWPDDPWSATPKRVK